MSEAFHYPGLDRAQCDQFSRWARMLQEENQRINLTRIIATEDIFVRHFADSLHILPLLDQMEGPKTLLDVGSGAGLPGLALAIARPDWHILSLEATGKKVRFQQRVVEALELANAHVIKGRAEALGLDPKFRETFGVVTARALARLNLLVELCLPLVQVGGVLMAAKGPEIDEEMEQAKAGLEILGGIVEQTCSYVLNEPVKENAASPADSWIRHTLVVIRKHKKTPKSYPRAYNVIQNRPL